jgi:outer membrane protein OmpA-like peptidoglycan-associated protein
MIIRLSLSTLMAAAIGLAASSAIAQPGGPASPTLRPAGGAEPQPLLLNAVPAVQRLRDIPPPPPPANGQTAEEGARNPLREIQDVPGDTKAKPAPKPKAGKAQNRRVEVKLSK